MNIYVGNLSFETTEDELYQVFAEFGEVISVIVMNDKYIGSGQGRGYAFVEMAVHAEGEAAVSALNGKKLGNMAINIVEALPLSNHKDNGYLNNKRPGHFRGKVRERIYKVN